MLHEFENWSRATPAGIDNGDEFIACNFAQEIQNTAIFTGYSDLRFFDCNLTNVDLPADAECERCNTSQVTYTGTIEEGCEITEIHPKKNPKKLKKAKKDALMKKIKNKYLRKKFKKAIEEATKNLKKVINEAA
jgi:hypothetical protein